MDKVALKHFIAGIWKEREAEGPQEQDFHKGATVLIVDDSRTIVHALKFMLERFGYYTVTAYDGEQGMEAANKWDPDIILMDIVMPIKNGFETIRALARNPETKNIPVIMMSGNDRPSDRMWGARLGAKGFLAKPIRMDDLLPKIKTVLASIEQDKDKRKSKQLSLLDSDASNNANY
jgi:twitching motility two-component system response regulator PilH